MPEEPQPQSKALLTFLWTGLSNRDQDRDQALPRPGVSGRHPHPWRDHILGRQLMFLLALLSSQLGNWSIPASCPFPPLLRAKAWGKKDNIQQGSPLQ